MTVSLAAALANPPARARHGRSILDEWLEQLNETERSAVLQAVANPAWGHVDLYRVLHAEGAPEVADTTFGTWRRKNGLQR